MASVYFLYSEEQIAEKNKILGKMGKKFIPGNVVVDGKRRKFSQIYDKPSMPRFVDTTIVANGEQSSFAYNDVSIVSAEGQ